MADRPTIITLAAGAKYSTSALNTNFQALRDEFDNILGVNGTSGANNTATGDWDMNGFTLRNATFDGDIAGIEWKGTWVTATAYDVNDVVINGSTTYICVIAHTSGTFATDLAAAKWEIFVSVSNVFDSILLTPQTSEPTFAEGTFFYDDVAKTFVGMVDESEIRMNVGEEIWVPGRNTSGSTLLNGKVGYISGVSGNNQLFSLAKADTVATSRIIGIFTHDIEDNSNGRMTSFGLVRGVDTSAFSVGDDLYLSETVAGDLTTTIPTGNANFKVRVAKVVVSNPATGILFVNVDGPVTSSNFTTTNTISELKGADVASAAALPVLTDGNFFDVTGTTTITSIDGIDATLGTTIKLQFDGILILTHNATDLILPAGGANITTAAGDVAEFVEYAAGDWVCTNYQKASGAALSGTILQALTTTKTDTFTTTSTTKVDVTGLSQAITLSNAANKVQITVMISGIVGGNGSLHLLRDSTEIALGDAAGSRTRAAVGKTGDGAVATSNPANVIIWEDTPGGVGPFTYKVQTSIQGGGTVFVNRGSADTDSNQHTRTVSVIRVEEIG